MIRGQASTVGAAGRTTIRPAAAVVFIVAMTAFAPMADASSFAVNPTQLVLSAKATSALLTLRNDSDETLRFQLSVFAWDQSTDGKLKLDQTDDIVFFPPLLTLAPKESRNIRIAAVTPLGAAERTYRIFAVPQGDPQDRDPHPGARPAGPGGTCRQGRPASDSPLRRATAAGGHREGAGHAA